MVVIGLILAAAAVGLAVGVLLEGGAGSLSLTLYGQQFSGLTPSELFLAGMVVAAVFIIGLVMIMTGIRRATRIRRELQDLRESHEEYVETLEAEKAQLERELSRRDDPLSDTGIRVASRSTIADRPTGATR